MELVSVAAVAGDLVIGDDGGIPWPSLPGDRAQYRARVADAPVILGRRTFESMLDDLPGRAQVVLSRTERDYDVPTAHRAGSAEEAIAVAESLGAETAYVLGGRRHLCALPAPPSTGWSRAASRASTRAARSTRSGTTRSGRRGGALDLAGP